jgi:hypothetical protein
MSCFDGKLIYEIANLFVPSAYSPAAYSLRVSPPHQDHRVFPIMCTVGLYANPLPLRTFLYTIEMEWYEAVGRIRFISGDM